MGCSSLSVSDKASFEFAVLVVDWPVDELPLVDLAVDELPADEASPNDLPMDDLPMEDDFVSA